MGIPYRNNIINDSVNTLIRNYKKLVNLKATS